MSVGSLRRRPVALLGTVVLIGAVGAVYVQAMLGHIGVYALPTAEVALTSFAPTEGGTALEGTIEFTNVASQRVTVYGASLAVYADGRSVSDPAGTATEGTEAAPGDTVAVPARVAIVEGSEPDVLAAYRNGSLVLGGDLFVGLGDRTVRISIEPRPITATADPGDGDG